MTIKQPRLAKPDRDSPASRRRLLAHSILSIDEELRLGLLIRITGDREALNKLVRHNLRFAAKIASRYAHYGVEFDDLFQQANLGLIEAAESYDPARGYRFITFAIWHIRNRIFESLNERHLIKRSSRMNDRMRAIIRATTELFATTGHEPTVAELAVHLGLSVAQVERTYQLIQQNIVYLDHQISADDDRTLGDVLPDATVSNEIYLLAHNELNLLTRWLERVVAVARKLKAEDCVIFLSRYGLDDQSYELRSYAEIERLTGISANRVPERIGSAIRKIRHIGVGSPLSEERLEFEIRRTRDIRTALVEYAPTTQVE